MPSQPLPVITGPAALHPTPDSLAIMLGTVAIETHGCKLNQADSAVLAEEFAKAGYRLVGSAADADVVVVNTCTVTATADAKARQAFGERAAPIRRRWWWPPDATPSVPLVRCGRCLRFRWW
jgi:hypothetical protein